MGLKAGGQLETGVMWSVLRVFFFFFQDAASSTALNTLKATDRRSRNTRKGKTAVDET